MTSATAQLAIRMRSIFIFTVLLSNSAVGLPAADDKPAAKDQPGAKPVVKPAVPEQPSVRAILDQEIRKLNTVVRRQLSQDTVLDFVDTPLPDALDFISTQHKIAIWIDMTSFSEEGIDWTIPVSARHRGVPLDTALRKLLKSAGSTFTIRHGVLIVQPLNASDDQSNELSTKSFPVFDLLRKHRNSWISVPRRQRGGGMFSTPSRPASTVPRQPTTLGQLGDGGFGSGGFGSGIGGLGGPGLPGASPFGTAGVFVDRQMYASGSTDWLTEFIQEHSQANWTDVDGDGGSLKLTGGVLVVQQTEPVLLRIAELLNALRKMISDKSPPAELEINPGASTDANDSVRRKLGMIVDAEFDDTALKKIVEFLAHRLSVPIQMDPQVLEDAGLSGDELITLKLKGTTARSVLSLLLQPPNLNFYVSDGTIQITTEELYEEHLSTLIFDLSRLRSPQYDLADTLMEVFPGPWMDVDGVGGRVSQPFPMVLVVTQNEHVLTSIAGFLHKIRSTGIKDNAEELFVDQNRISTRFYKLPDDATATQLVESLPVFVQPGSWNSFGNVSAIRTVGSMVVVRQRQFVHEEIARFVEDVLGRGSSGIRPMRLKVSGRPRVNPQKKANTPNP